MSQIAIIASIACVFMVSLLAAQVAAPTATPTPPASAAPSMNVTKPSTVIPVPRNEEWWQERHAATLERVKSGPTDLIFIGDSITQGWEGDGREAWSQHFAPRHAVNLGFSGDRTQHVLWRLQNGEIDFVGDADPRLAVIMIGTNNSHGDDNTAEEIAAGIEAIIALLRAELPETKILLLAIFPRGEGPNPQRDKNAAASARASKLADGRMIHFLDIGPKFLAADGTLPKEIMPDLVHLSARGYEIWAEAIEAKVDALMADSATSASKPAAK